MAGHWIKWEKGLTHKPEVLTIASMLGVTEQHAAATCMQVWEWADDVSTDGLVRSRPEALDRITGQPGIADALQAVGWLTVSENALQFPNYDRHNGRTAKERALDAARKFASRAQMSGRQPDRSRTKFGRVHS